MSKNCWVVGIALLVGMLGVFPAVASAGCTITVQPGESIQAALNAAPEDAVVCLSAGQWEEDIVIRKSLTLRGEGPASSLIRTKDSEAGAAVVITSDGAEPVQAVIADLAVHGNADAAGIAVIRTAQLAITNCTISGSEIGLMLINSAQLTMSDCTLRGNMVLGIAVWDEAQGTITGCTISGSQSGIALGDLARATVENNWIIDNEIGVLLLDESAGVVGTGNAIPGPGEADGNSLAAVDPAELSFLMAPREDPAPPTAPPGWKAVRVGDLCLMVPEDWSDYTEELRREVGEPDSDEGEVLGAWEGDAIESRIGILRLPPEEFQEQDWWKEFAAGAELVEEGPYDLAGRPARQFLFSVIDVDGARMWTARQDDPGHDGWYLLVMAAYWAADEPVLQEILDSISVCDDVVTAPDVPTTGTIRFTLDDESYSFPAVGHRDPETGGTAIAGGSVQAAVSLSFAEVDSPGSYSPETAGTTFIFQWLDGDPPFRPNVPGTPTYMATTGFFPVQLTITEYGPVGGTIRGEFHGPTLSGAFEVERTH